MVGEASEARSSWTGRCKRGLARRDGGWWLQGAKWVGPVLLVASALANSRAGINGSWITDREMEYFNTWWLRKHGCESERDCVRVCVCWEDLIETAG